ncbi:MAG TPA: winged helix-turn-helix transcriptional regulator [Sphingobium sp.]|nr:winged helix-turn-helix transcriptional regulator [Sphingobium sp.]
MKLEKETNRSSAAINRRYDDACGTAHGLELLGERWAMFVVRELMLGPRRFSDLRNDLPGLSANVLTQRLTELEARGIVEKAMLPPPAQVQVYGLTDWGYEAEIIIRELGRWAARSPLHDPTLPISPVSIMLSLRTLILPERTRSLDVIVGFRFGALAFRGHVKNGWITITRAEPDDAAAIFTGTAPGLGAYVHGGVPITELAQAGLLHAEGDPALIALFPTLFQLPAKLPPKE